MKERPILFSAPMVRAILDGTKTQTRRVVKDSAWRDFGDCDTDGRMVSAWGIDPAVCPFGGLGDRLWVRESWQFFDWTEDGEPCIKFAADGKPYWPSVPENADWDRLESVWVALSARENYAVDNAARDRRWRPSIHMPRWASRITLEITEVRAQRLQEISYTDAKAEGCGEGLVSYEADYSEVREACNRLGLDAVKARFALLWDSINGAGAWQANPWVWALTFRRVAGAPR